MSDDKRHVDCFSLRCAKRLLLTCPEESLIHLAIFMEKLGRAARTMDETEGFNRSGSSCDSLRLIAEDPKRSE